MIVNCSQCDKELQVTPSQYKKNNNFFCNKSCESIFRKATPNVECVVCKKKIHRKPSYAQKVTNITCSVECMGKLKEDTSLGNLNPNSKYFYNRNLFDSIDTEGKSYLLGWLASDGHLAKNNVAKLSIHKKDKSIFYQIFKILGTELPIREEDDQRYIAICSKEIVQKACEHLGIIPGKKDSKIIFPNLESDSMKISFIRGFFDGDGSVRQPQLTEAGWSYPSCDISTNSDKLRESIALFMDIPHHNDIINKKIYWWGNNALDFLSKLYDSAKYWLPRKRDIYHDICSWVPGIGGNASGVGLHFRWTKTDANALPPSKERASDSGFDITAIKIHKKIGKVILYDTGIKVQPEFGWYFDLVPRSSIIKSGYILANDLGIIDRTYTGNVMIALMKVDENLPDLELPKRIAQLIPRPVIHMDVVEVDSIDETSRGDGGFGSTGI